MLQRKVRVYTDTSVYGGFYDEEYEHASRRFFDQVRAGRFILVTSDLVREEIADAPEEVRVLFSDLSKLAELSAIDDVVLSLRDAYLEAGIVGRKSLADALHVAAATVAGCDAIVSWNFRHIVHWEKIPLYNEINRANGYHEIAIHSPQEVTGYEDEDI
jgi:predicted nucleic acid-binding protein